MNKYYCHYNANPKNKNTDDCVIRAISVALDQPYNMTYKDLFDLSLSTGFILNERRNYSKYLESKGWIMQKQPRKTNNKKYTGKEFCRKIPTSERVFAHIGAGHVVAIVNKKVFDTWDSSDGCIGNYWIKKGA